MNITVLCVGKQRESSLKLAADEYVKRLSRYHHVTVEEVPDQPEPIKPSQALYQQVKEREGEALLRRIRSNDFVVALAIEGVAPDSLGFARMVEEWSMLGRRVVFVIGGSLGLAKAVLNRADLKVSFSKMTFPHQLMRVILLEQIYRAARINANERYHK